MVTGSLDGVLETLKSGMYVKGIVQVQLKHDQYLIRVRGKNILTKSEKKLRVHQKVIFKVKQIEPHLILALERRDSSLQPSGIAGGTDLLI